MILFRQNKPTSQAHQMLQMLLKSYPKGVENWIFSTPREGIMNKWETCRVLRSNYKLNIATDYKEHKNRFGRMVRVGSYRLKEDSILLARAVELKMRSNGIKK